MSIDFGGNSLQIRGGSWQKLVGGAAHAAAMKKAIGQAADLVSTAINGIVNKAAIHNYLITEYNKKPFMKIDNLVKKGIEYFKRSADSAGDLLVKGKD